MFRGFMTYPHMGLLGWGVGWVATLAFWLILIWAAVALFRHLGAGSRQDGHPEKGPAALDILKERYAKGEISKKEFEEMKKDIA